MSKEQLSDITVPLSTLKKLPKPNSILGCIKQSNHFKDNQEEAALIVMFRDLIRDGGGLRKSLFSVEDGTYMGEY